MGKRPIENGKANNLVNMNLDNVIVLLLVVLTIFSIWFNVGLLRLFGVVLSIPIMPIIGILSHIVLGINITLVSLTAVLALYIVILSGSDMLVKRRCCRL